MGPITGLTEFFGMLRRRGPIMAAVLVVGIYLALSHALSLPRAYEAITVIQIQPTLMGAAPGAEAEADTASRLRLIEQQLMARGNILDMIDRYNLFDDAPELSDDERIAQFRQNARVEFIPVAGGAPGADAGVSAMLITVRAGRAEDAANLANDMADQIMNGNETTRRRRTADLIATLEAEDRRAAQAVAEVEARLAAYRAVNPDRMPENMEFLAAEQTRLQAQRSALIISLQALERERLAIEVGTVEEGPRTSVAQQLRVLEVDLAQARRTLAPNHPEVQRLEEQVERLRVGNAELLAPGISRQVDLIREQEAALNAERAQIERRLPQIDAAIAAMPEASAELAEFGRQIAVMEAPRAAISERLSRIQLEQRLTDNDHGERMVVLERATPADYPLSSGRRRVAVLGAGTSIAMALIAGFLMELMRPVLRTPGQVRKSLGVEPIAVARYRPSPRARIMARAQDMASLGILGFGVLAVVILMLTRTG
ncbi:hypothetical protein PANO111632_08170 [Paracoccus nototheniae]|uniref:GumC family protein n=1 Tax=Paracoccus nototheniae TaxID=2489002 RepID=A0ABW4DU70_9RHOB|nr:hypothetical protein [Paracoccus nototheniae]